MYVSVVLVASLLIPFASLMPTVGGTYGVDVSSLVSPDNFKCLKNNGIDFVIVRAYESLGHADANAPHTIANAREAGIQYVDVYLFPCPTCEQSATEQVNEMVGYLDKFQSNYGQIWLDIEGSQLYWHKSYSENQQFFEEMLQAASSHTKTGVYTSSFQWNPIMGNYTGGSGHQLWYAHYDNSASFDDFSPFGGWSRPAIKQYAGDVSLCDVDVDKDWY